jgi:hypothetical protein
MSCQLCSSNGEKSQPKGLIYFHKNNRFGASYINYDIFWMGNLYELLNHNIKKGKYLCYPCLKSLKYKKIKHPKISKVCTNCFVETDDCAVVYSRNEYYAGHRSRYDYNCYVNIGHVPDEDSNDDYDDEGIICDDCVDQLMEDNKIKLIRESLRNLYGIFLKYDNRHLYYTICYMCDNKYNKINQNDYITNMCCHRINLKKNTINKLQYDSIHNDSEYTIINEDEMLNKLTTIKRTKNIIFHYEKINDIIICDHCVTTLLNENIINAIKPPININYSDIQIRTC